MMVGGWTNKLFHKMVDFYLSWSRKEDFLGVPKRPEVFNDLLNNPN